jgi:hypothetical protein
MIILIIQKSLKSLQIKMNEFSLYLDNLPVTASAFSQARLNLHYMVFIALNKSAVVDVFYQEGEVKRFKGYRVLAIDGSRIRLPKHPTTQKEFGEISYNNQHIKTKETHVYGHVSVMYDVLNHIAIDSTLSHCKDDELNLAIGHITHSEADDLLLFDWHYPSYKILSYLCAINRKFVIRCSGSSYKKVRKMIKNQGSNDQKTTLTPHHSRIKEIEFHGLPKEIDVRFIRIPLKTGEYEILVTNLMDESLFPTDLFKEIYFMRWGIEGFYGLLKTRLNLENFTGKTAKTVYQDFYSTIYLTGLETLLTADSNQKLSEKKQTKYAQKVNHAISFNAIKNQAFALLYSNIDDETLYEKLTILFLTNPTIIRTERYIPRKKHPPRNQLNHAIRVKKIVF